MDPMTWLEPIDEIILKGSQHSNFSILDETLEIVNKINEVDGILILKTYSDPNRYSVDIFYSAEIAFF